MPLKDTSSLPQEALGRKFGGFLFYFQSSELPGRLQTGEVLLLLIYTIKFNVFGK